jgi:ketose-bisphosphate aldolase
MRGKTIEILTEAKEGGYAVGAFNTTNLEFTQGIVRAANELNRNCIIQITPKTMRYAYALTAGKLIDTVIENESEHCRIGVHLDHGKSLDDVAEAIEAGVDSVMIDASREAFKENVAITKRVVDYAHQKGVTVQAELGYVPYLGREEQTIKWENVMTKPEEAAELVEKTGIDALAVGIESEKNRIGKG